MRKLLGVLLATAALAAVAVPAAAPATASADAFSWCGNFCNGHDPNYSLAPYREGWIYCVDDAYTASSHYNAGEGLTIQLRYSNKCETVWARAVGGTPGKLYRISMNFTSGFSAGNPKEVFTNGENWGYMWNDHNVLIRACAENAATAISYGCTSYY